MPFNGAGLYAAPSADFPAVSNTLIESTKFNNVINDIATGLSTCIAKDGQTTITANLPMAGFKHTGVTAASGKNSRTEYTSGGTVQDGTLMWAGDAGGTANALTLTLTPAITAYTTPQIIFFKATETNTGAATVVVSGLSAKTIQKNGAALVSNDILDGKIYGLIYDGTQFQLLSVQQAPAGNQTQTLTDGANIAFDVGKGKIAKVTLGGNRTFDNMTNLKAGDHGFFDVIQDATGSRTITWGASYVHVLGAAPTLSTTAGARDRFYWSTFDGTVVDLVLAKGMDA